MSAVLNKIVDQQPANDEAPACAPTVDMALLQRRHEGVILHSDSKNTGTRYFRGVTVSKQVAFGEGLVP